ncbi:hypothetical protein, partial [Streptococcus sobrinus]|uniref:hypothetical protein n=1 Tax=Streptococcus sobrinus TaxID=1310 RepID=UPI0005B31168
DYATRGQSEDRVHRIGQKNKVIIYDIMADKTLDERIIKCLWRKENLVDSFKFYIERMKDKKDLKMIEEWVEGGNENEKSNVS